ncbi:hypothetical protein [Geodermatophilus sp. SYSU D00079]
MPFVVTAVPSRGDGAGRVEAALRRLGGLPAVRPFARVGDGEVQGLLADPAVVVDVVLELVRAPGWAVGVGAGAVPDGGRSGGPALLSARRAADAAGQRGTRLAVRGAVPSEAADAQAVLTALAVVVQRRSPQAWEAIELVAAGRTQSRAAAALGISRQAVGQRLAAGLWELERELRPTAVRLLARAEG